MPKKQNKEDIQKGQKIRYIDKTTLHLYIGYIEKIIGSVCIVKSINQHIKADKKPITVELPINMIKIYY